MGYALPAAIGAHYATRKPVACICGDGAFQMNIQELQWVKRENIPVKIVVMNNEALGMIRHLQRDYFDCVYADTSDGSGFSSCDFSDVAKAYGNPGKKDPGVKMWRKFPGEFLGQERAGASGDHVGKRNLCVPEDLSWGADPQSAALYTETDF